MRYQTMPPLPQDERDALERSIREYGIQVPIVVDEWGEIIDGHHRASIAASLGISCPKVSNDKLTEAQKVAMSISLNVDRRQLTAAQKRDVVARVIVTDPTASNRRIAEQANVGHPFVAKVRTDLERSGDVESDSTRTDSLGRQQPASKPVISITTRQSESVTENFNPATGEAIDSIVNKSREALAAGVVPPEKVESIERLVEADDRLQNSRYIQSFLKALRIDFVQFDADRIANLADADVIRQIELTAESVARFQQQITRSRRGLRLIEGGK